MSMGVCVRGVLVCGCVCVRGVLVCEYGCVCEGSACV